MSKGYTGSDIRVLEGLEAVRKRPGMYIGGTGSPGLQHCIWEIVDNSVDEALAGHCTRIEITLHKDGSVTVADNGRGIPVDIEPKTGLSALEVVFTKLHAGGKFGGGGYQSAGGLHGVGASVVNALSARVDVEVRRDSTKTVMSFKEGTPGVWTGNGPDGKFTPKGGVKTAGKAPKKDTGTTVTFWPDRGIFHPEAVIDPDQVRTRARQTAFLVPGLTIQVRDLTGTKPQEDTYQFAGGIADMVDHMTTGSPACDVVHFTGTGTFTENVPVMDTTGHLKPTDVEREVHVDVAIRWTTGYDTAVRSFVNVVATPKGGTHLKGFERGLLAAIRKGYDGTRLMKANEDPVTGDDISEGLVAVVSVGFPEPQFEGQTKEVLGTPAITKIVQDVVNKGVAAWIGGRKKAQARTVLEKIANAARTRVASRTQREAARRKTALEGASMPAKLVDCRATGVHRSELFIVEGDSALGSARAARNSEYQALLPIRGKILNVQKATLAQVLANNECSSIIQVIGAGSGRTFDIEQMRYGRMMLMSVPSDEWVFVTDERGFRRLARIGPLVDGYLDEGRDAPGISTVSLDVENSRAVESPLKRVIRHQYQGQLRTIETMHGRRIRVTGNHSVFTYDNGKINLRLSSTLREGDVLVAPRRLPSVSSPTLEVDLVQLLIDAGLTDNVFVSGESVELIRSARAVERSRDGGACKHPLDRRVLLDAAARQSLISARKEAGLTQKDVALRLGYKQPITVSYWETGKQAPAETVYRELLDLYGLTWQTGASFMVSLYDWNRSEHEESLNTRYRKTSAHHRLSDLSSEDIFRLGRDTSLTLKNNRKSFPRFMPVTEAFCEFLGWFAAEGSTSRGQVSLSLGQDDDEMIPHILDLIRQVTGEEARVHISEKFPTKRKVYFNSALFARVLEALGALGTASTKRVPDLMFNVDATCQTAYLRGMYLGDGCKPRRMTGGLTLAVTVSHDLANGIGYILASLGVVAGTSQIALPASPGEIERRHPAYSVVVTGRAQIAALRGVWDASPRAKAIYDWIANARFDRGSQSVAISDDLIGLPIRSISDSHVDEMVYDFSVADTESFVAGSGGGVMAHNTDADVDGSHIRALLLTLFARYMRPVIEEGRMFTAVPPLHKVETTGRNKETIYTYSEAEMRDVVAKLERAGKTVKKPIPRFKGLGEMNAEELWETTMDPAVRTVRQITMADAQKAEAALELLMGNEVAPRREFIIDNADRVNPDAIDT